MNGIWNVQYNKRSAYLCCRQEEGTDTAREGSREFPRSQPETDICPSKQMEKKGEWIKSFVREDYVRYISAWKVLGGRGNNKEA